jgi:hypothetical protein
MNVRLSLVFVAMVVTVQPVHGQTKPSVTVGRNVQISVDHSADGVSESWISTDPKDPSHLIACAIVYPTGLNRRNTAVYASIDGGRTWRATLNVTSHLDQADPACTLGPDGVASFVSLAFPDQSGIEMVVHRSTDFGISWTQQPTVRMRAAGIDRETVVADATGGRFNGRFYITGMTLLRETDKPHSPHSGLAVWTSTDRGLSFRGPSIRASPSNRYTYGMGNSVVLNDGTLLTLFGENLNPDSIGRAAPTARGRASAIIEVAASNDGGETYEQAVKIADKYPGEVSSGAITTPSMAADPGSPSFAGNVYAVWLDFRAGNGQLLLSRSTDNGKTWSPPHVVNDVLPEAADVIGPNVFMPNVAANRDGVVLVTWYDRNNHPGNLGWRIRARASIDGGETWLPSVEVSSASNVNRQDGKHTLYAGASGGGAREWWARGGDIKLRIQIQPHEFWASDYSGLAADVNGVFHALWTDNRTGMPQLWTAPISVSGGVARNGDPALASLGDVNNKVALEIVDSRLDPASANVEITARLINTSSDTLRAPFKVRVIGISSQLAEVVKPLNASNGIKGIGAVWDYTSAVPGGVLAPSAVSELRPMIFSLEKWKPMFAENAQRTILVELTPVVLAAVKK